MTFLHARAIFYVLMIVTAAITFVYPLRPNWPINVLFSPVDRPVRAAVGWVTRSVTPKNKVDVISPDRPRPIEDVLEENARLHTQISNLLGQIDRLAATEADRQKVGDVLRKLCEPMAVAGMASDPNPDRQILLLDATKFAGLRTGQFVIVPNGVVGKVSAVSPVGAAVQLITDPGTSFNCSYERANADGSRLRLPLAQSTIFGGGRSGAMFVTLRSMKEVEDAKLRVNDWVVVDDPQWPEGLSRFPIGRVVEIAPRKDAPATASIRIEPFVNLRQLREVLVMVR